MNRMSLVGLGALGGCAAEEGLAAVCTVGRFTPYRRTAEPATLSMR